MADDVAPKISFPALPDLPTDLALKVFTDPSLRAPGENGSSHTDNEVLAVVGEAATGAAYSAILFARQPGLTVEELKEIRSEWMSPKTVTPWLEHYKDFQNVRVLPTKERTPDMVWRAFYAYMGALYLSRGEYTLQRFLVNLVDPQYVTPAPAGPPPPSWSQPHSQAPHLSCISMLNQEAQKQGFKVEYVAESKGVAHALQWEVGVIVNGKHQGRGSGGNKQAAKEAAAKEALAKLGYRICKLPLPVPHPALALISSPHVGSRRTFNCVGAFSSCIQKDLGSYMQSVFHRSSQLLLGRPMQVRNPLPLHDLKIRSCVFVLSTSSVTQTWTMQEELDEIRQLADLPLILDLEMADRVFSHKSLFARPAHVHVETEEPPDYERLAFLGDQVLAFLATDIIFERYAYARPSFLTEKRALVTNNEEIAKWSSAYGLPHQIKAHPSQQAVVQTSITVRAGVFEAYIGAVFTESGMDLVGTWIKPLIRRVLDIVDIDDFAQRTPRSDPSPFPSIRGDSDLGTDDMSEQILLHRQLETMSIAETTSTGVGSGIKGYSPSMNQFTGRSIAPSSHDGSLNSHYTPSTTYMETAHAQPIPVATGKSSPLKKEIRDYQLGHDSPNFSGNHAPSHLSNAPNSQYSTDTMPNIPPYGHQQSQQSPPFASGSGSFRSSSSSTVRPPARSPQDSPGAPTGMPSPQPSPSAASSSSSDSTSSQSSTKSVTGGHLALFNQMAIQKKQAVEWKIASTGPPHRPKFEAQVFVHNLCHGRGQALTKKQAQQGAAEAALRSLGWV